VKLNADIHADDVGKRPDGPPTWSHISVRIRPPCKREPINRQELHFVLSDQASSSHLHSGSLILVSSDCSRRVVVTGSMPS
jgi:hypothetical protein